LLATSLLFADEHDIVSRTKWPTWLPVPSVREIYFKAASRYLPKEALGIPAVLVRALEGSGNDEAGIKTCASPDFGWGPLIGPSLDIVDSAGGHATLLQEPTVDGVAKSLLTRL
jgi:thioesterase domain-containing protein